jgi:hypothetical protein
MTTHRAAHYGVAANTTGAQLRLEQIRRAPTPDRFHQMTGLGSRLSRSQAVVAVQTGGGDRADDALTPR